MGGQFRVQDGKALVHELEPVVHTVHGATDVARALARDEAVEGDKGFGFGARGVEEGRAEDVHALDVDARGGAAGFGPFGVCRGGGVVRVLDGWGSVLELGASELVGGIGEGLAVGEERGRFCVVEFPGYGVEEADEGCFADAPFEERVCGEGAEGVVADFGIGWGGAAVD